MAISDRVANTIFVSVVSAVGAMDAFAVTKLANKYGHHLIKKGYNNPSFVGLIGSVHNLASLFLTAKYQKATDTESQKLAKFFVSHIVIGSALFGLTVLAAKVNLIANRLNLVEMGMLIVANFFSSLLTIMVREQIEKLRD